MTPEQKMQIIHRLLDIQQQTNELARDVLATLAPEAAPADPVPELLPADVPIGVQVTESLARMDPALLKTNGAVVLAGTMRHPDTGGLLKLPCGCAGQCRGHAREG